MIKGSIVNNDLVITSLQLDVTINDDLVETAFNLESNLKELASNNEDIQSQKAVSLEKSNDEPIFPIDGEQVIQLAELSDEDEQTVVTKPKKSSSQSESPSKDFGNTKFDENLGFPNEFNQLNETSQNIIQAWMVGLGIMQIAFSIEYDEGLREEWGTFYVRIYKERDIPLRYERDYYIMEIIPLIKEFKREIFEHPFPNSTCRNIVINLFDKFVEPFKSITEESILSNDSIVPQYISEKVYVTFKLESNNFIKGIFSQNVDFKRHLIGLVYQFEYILNEWIYESKPDTYTKSILHIINTIKRECDERGILYKSYR